MKTLSLLQPWASLVVLGHKKIETRSWNTKYRGPLLIHASQSRKSWRALDGNKHFEALLKFGAIDMPLGAIIGQVNVIGSYKSTHFPMTQTVMPHYYDQNRKLHHIPFTDQEEAFGDFSPGRYGWLLSDPFIFDVPIPAKGKLGIWNWEG